jgi:nucleotide-binding universal stress UspA family protein
MIKVVMVRLDGTEADDFRLGIATSLSRLFEAHLSCLFVNALPVPIAGADAVSIELWTRLLRDARDAGDVAEAAIQRRLADIPVSHDLRRFDIFADAVASTCAREARRADTFIGLRETAADPPAEFKDVVKEVLFDSGHHLLMAADNRPFEQGFNHALIAWKVSREAARAVKEALPYLHKARAVTVLVVRKRPLAEDDALLGEEAVAYLGHHGITAKLHRAAQDAKDVGALILDEITDQNADLVVMGGFGRLRVAEWLLGGVTDRLIYSSPAPLVIAH